MAQATQQPNSQAAPVDRLTTDDEYREFHSYRWDLDQDFLGGVVLALGGYKSLQRTGSQADIILHSRIFYYHRIKGITIPYAGYKQWLRSNPSTPLWEWSLLESLCNHRDQVARQSRQGGEVSPDDEAAAARVKEDAAVEKRKWLDELLTSPVEANSHPAEVGSTLPAWQAAAPTSQLYVEQSGRVATTDHVPYPEQFARIIQAVQSGQQIEGIIDVPDTLARTASTTPFGKMARPRKPWEKLVEGGSANKADDYDAPRRLVGETFPDPDEMI